MIERIPHNRVKDIDYKERPSISDFAYYVTSISGKPTKNMQIAFQEIKQKYGIDIKFIPWGTVPQFDGRAPYILVDTGAHILPTLTHEEQNYIGELGQLPNARINLIGTYDDDRLRYGADYGAPPTSLIPTFDRRFGVNTIYADDIVNGYVRTNSARDIADNIICETLRLKVNSKRDSSEYAEQTLLEEQRLYLSEIEEARKVYKKYGLWHRSETDGAVALRTDRGCLVTQTKTDKTTMTPDNFSLVHSYSEGENSVTFTGEKIPTSDVEIIAALDRLEKYKMAVHFHHNGVTRGNKFSENITAENIEYGRFESADKIVTEMERIGEDWIIIKEHGVLWFGNSIIDFERFVVETLGIAKSLDTH